MTAIIQCRTIRRWTSISWSGDGSGRKDWATRSRPWTSRRAFLHSNMGQKAYARAGVDIDLGNRVKATLPQLLASTHRREVLGKVGGFGGLFQLDLKKYREPVLVSSVDGVGTKL